MDKHFFHPLGDNAPDYTAFTTYSGHGIGNLDYGVAAGTPVYAMCDGIISYCGWGTTICSQTGEPNTYCILKCSAENNNLGEAFYIRYLHGDYTVQTGDKIQKGQQIGTIASHGNSTGPHLHIDFTFATPPTSTPADYPRDPAVAGSLLQENNNYYFIYNNKRYLINNNIHIEKVIEWRNINGGGMDVGYCWLVFAQNPQYLEPSPTEDGVPLNKNQFHSGPTDSHLEAVEAYFNDEFSDNFIGPCPVDWNDLINDTNGDHKSLRCLIDFCMHELGSWPIACTLCAKLMRADVLASSYLNVSGGAGQATTYYDWMRTVTTNLPGFIGPWEGYVDGIYIYNNGNGFINPNSIQYLAQTDENFKRVLAIYNNFKKSSYYGTNLQDPYLEKSNYLPSIIKGASIMPMANGGYWSMVSEALSNAIVNYNPITNTDDGKINLESYYGRILVYRQDGNISYFNTQPFN